MSTIILLFALSAAPRCEGGVCVLPQKDPQASPAVKHHHKQKRGFRLFRRGCRGGKCG